MALGTLATIALVGSAAAGIGSVVEARNARKDQERALEQQQTAAREAAAKRNVREDTGAEIVLGSDTDTGGRTSTKRKTTATRRSVLGSAGGLSTAKRIGL